MSTMNLTEWAKTQGISQRTAYRWYKAGTMPVAVTRINSRSLLILEQGSSVAPGVGIYARVSSHDQKNDLTRQVARLEQWAHDEGLEVVEVCAEVGSGMNGQRPKIRRLLSDPTVGVLVVEHRDRLGRMNTELIEAALHAANRRVVVIDDAEIEDDLVRDMIEVLTSFCARFYGRRGAQNRARAALARAQELPA
jgi:putative resolvase